MNIAILGYGSQGVSAYNYWKNLGHNVTICDNNLATKIPIGAESQLGEGYLSNLSRFDLLVRTPILHPSIIVKANSDDRTILNKVTTNTSEFIKVCPTKNVIGITGTKGKGTTSTLIARLLESAGKRVHLGGNIGIPPLELLKNDIKSNDWVVLELANFQLIDLKSSPQYAVCLMVEPEHLDWHIDLDEYINAKQQLFTNQQPDDKAVYYAENELSTKIASASPGHKIPYFQKPGAYVSQGKIFIDNQIVCDVSDLQLIGEHNWQNVCAAITTVWQISHDLASFSKTLKTFSGLPYRIERRREVRGLKFYNDSFASAPGATIAAIEAISDKKVVILGGYDRGLSLEQLADCLKKHGPDIRRVIIVGNSAARLSEALEAKGFFNYVHESSRNMSAIVERAMGFASRGDAILLSPGFASFDMFKNFEERGNAFNKVVDRL